MSEYWKSTVSQTVDCLGNASANTQQPKYWCKFCSTYVKDTKLERAQHEATGRHQGNIQRSLRGLHREQENEQRAQARAKAEVERLNGLVPSAKTTLSVASGSGGPAPTFKRKPEKKATVDDRKRQWAQLAAMGIMLPDEARGDLAIAGDWKAVRTEVIGEVNDDGEFKAMALNKGVHKRKLDEEEEEELAAREMITKRKGWGHTFKSFPGSKSVEDGLESLLGKKVPQTDTRAAMGVKSEEPADSDESKTLQDIPTAEEAHATVAAVKLDEDAAAPTVTFKKRKKIAK
jgi:hypothetical protein